MQSIDAIEAIQLSERTLKKRKNSFLYFTGDNGCGKSTLLLNIAKNIFHKNRELSVTQQPLKDVRRIIAYSMAPFSKFDSREAYIFARSEAFERIGGGSSGTSRYALLFQAIVQFCMFDSAKQALFQEIAEVTRFSATFRVRLRIDRLRLERAPQQLVESNELAKKILDSVGVIEVFIRPGTLKITAGDESDLRPSDFERQLPSQDSDESENIAEALMLLRRFGAVRVARVEYAKFDDTWCSSDNLSSGQLSFFVGLMVLASALRDNCTVLIDEPEVSLHPAWQEKYPELLYKMAKYYQGCKFYVATHSPMIISSAQKGGAKIVNLGSELISAADLADSDPENIEEIFAIYFNTLTLDSHFVKEAAIKAVQALAENDSNAFAVYSRIIEKIRPKVKDSQTKKLLSEILKRTVP